jgi:hypothetical protein
MDRKLFLFALFIILVAVLAIAIWQGWSHHEAVWTWLEWLVIPQWPDWMMGWVQTLLNITIVIIAVAVIVGLVLGLVWLYRRIPAATPHPAVPAPGPVPPAPAPAPTPTPARLARRRWPWGKMIFWSVVLIGFIVGWNYPAKDTQTYFRYVPYWIYYNDVGHQGQETFLLTDPDKWSDPVTTWKTHNYFMKAVNPEGVPFWMQLQVKGETAPQSVRVTDDTYRLPSGTLWIKFKKDSETPGIVVLQMTATRNGT